LFISSPEHNIVANETKSTHRAEGSEVDERRRRASWSRTKPGKEDGDPERVLRFDGEWVSAEGLEPAFRVTREVFASGAHDDAVEQVFGVDVLVALHALTRYVLNPEPPPQGVRLQTRWSAGSGGIWGAIELHGRALVVRTKGSAWEDLEFSVDELDESTELPEAYAERIDADAWAGAKETAMKAASLACYCGTGVKEARHHGSLTRVEERVNPDIPLDNATTSYVCRVCGRGWTFSYAGDSHYSYHYSSYWIDPGR